MRRVATPRWPPRGSARRRSSPSTIGTVDLGAVFLVSAMAAAGFLAGMIMPSRDMLVRAAAPPGMAGRTFGIVTTGFNIGGTIGPMLGGWLMDRGEPRWIFYSSVCFMITDRADGPVRRLAVAPPGTWCGIVASGVTTMSELPP